ncbi:MAG: nuclear transport factor 2 family protein [Pseudomonadota bacterium]
MRIQLLAAVAIVAVSTPVTAFADNPFDKIRFDDISAVLQKYLDGTQYGKPELVEDAFLPSLEVQFLNQDRTLGRRAAAAYIGNIEKDKEVSRNGRIISIDGTHNAAMAKIEIDTGTRLYTDYMLLLKVEGEWRISNKIATWITQD